MIKFSVDGVPVPQGSMKHIGQGRMIHARSKELALWRASIALAADRAECKIHSGPIKVKAVFRLKRPKTVKRLFPIVAPDLDKLIRGLLDALTNVAYEDDAQVIDIIAEKVYSDTPGVDVEIYWLGASNLPPEGLLFS